MVTTVIRSGCQNVWLISSFCCWLEATRSEGPPSGGQIASEYSHLFE